MFFLSSFIGVSYAQKVPYKKENISNKDKLLGQFRLPPDSAKSRVYWFWIYNRVTKEGITRDLEEFKAKGISGVNLICNGGYGGKQPLLGVTYLGDEWRALFRHAVRETKRLNIELGFNMAGGWTMMGPSVTQDYAMKKVVSTQLKVTGPGKLSVTIAKPEVVEGYYHEIKVQAFQVSANTNSIDPKKIIDLSSKLMNNNRLDWDAPAGDWVILRTGYTLTGHPWSKWKAYPEGDTFKGGEGYQIDYLNTAALDDYFSNLGQTVIAEAKKAGGKIETIRFMG
ncbi:MAG: hypothetical protein EOO93_26500, partial [Pedobacter sp.]